MSTELDPIAELLKSITPAESGKMVHDSQQTLRELDAGFARRLLDVVLRTHPECMDAVIGMHYRMLLLDALQKLEARTTELMAIADRQYHDRLCLQSLAMAFPEIQSLASYRLQHGAVVDGSHSMEG